jgi:hypothetical protein
MGALIVFFFVLIGAVIIFYASAKSKLKNYENDQKDYQLLVDNLNKLETRLQDEADHWPIYARPMLFTDVDHESQLEFAKAQKAMSEAHGITPDLQETIDQPIVKPSLLYIFENIRIIRIGSHFRSQIYSLAYKSIDLARSIIALNNNQNKINQKRSLVKANIKKLQASIDEANKQVNGIEKNSAGSVTQIYWTITTAQEAHDSAQKEIIPKPNSELEDDQGDLVYAIADVYATIGNIAIKCFHLYCDSLKEIGRYELDIFRGLFQESIDHLHSILKIKDINGWKKLRRAKPPIDEFPIKETQARASLDDFRQKRLAFETIEQQLSKLEWDAKIIEADKVQEKCGRYWTPYQENRSEWQIVLENRVLPKTRLIQLRDLCISNIIPATALGALIQQSSLPTLTQNISKILKEIQIADFDVSNLSREYEKNLIAEEWVRLQVAKEGQLFITISNIQRVANDSDDDLISLCLILIERYNGFIERIKMVRGANFPDLATQINVLLSECNGLIVAYKTRVAECEMKYKRLITGMRTSLNELRKYIDISPSLDQQHIMRLEQLAIACKLLLEESTGNRYLSMRSLVGRMEEWNQTGAPFIAQTKARMENFNSLCDQTENSIIRAIAFMNNNRPLA